MQCLVYGEVMRMEEYLTLMVVEHVGAQRDSTVFCRPIDIPGLRRMVVCSLCQLRGQGVTMKQSQWMGHFCAAHLPQN